MFPLIWKCWFLRSGENRSTLYLKRNLAEQGENPQQTQPTFGVTARVSARATLVRALRHPCYRLLKTSGYRCLIIEVIVPHRDGLGVLLLYQSQSHFAKWKINIKLFFSVKTIARNLGKMYHSLTAGHLQLDESVRLNTLVIRCFFTSPTTVSKLLSPFYKKRGHKKRFFSHHHKFRAPTTSKPKAEARHHPSV